MALKKFVKYQNRKLYFHELSRYVVSKEIKNLIWEGHEVQILNHHDKVDITQQTLSNIVFYLLKGKDLPIQALYDLINSYNPNNPNPNKTTILESFKNLPKAPPIPEPETPIEEKKIEELYDNSVNSLLPRGSQF